MGIHTYMYRASIEISFPLTKKKKINKKREKKFKTLLRLKNTNTNNFYVLLSLFETSRAKAALGVFVRALYVYLCIKYLIFIYVYQMHTC